MKKVLWSVVLLVLFQIVVITGTTGETFVDDLAWVTILCDLGNESQHSTATLEYLAGLLGFEYPGVGHYFATVSGGLVSLENVIVGPYDISGGGAYLQDGEFDFYLAGWNCIQAASVGVDFGAVYGINIVFDEDVGTPVWGGREPLIFDDAARNVRIYGITWLPRSAIANQAILAHEMLHALGRPHTNSPLDVMGGMWGATAHDPVYGEVASAPIAYHLDQLGWIPEEAIQVVQPDSKATILLGGGSAGKQIIRLVDRRSSLHYFTVEAYGGQLGYTAHLSPRVLVHYVDLTLDRTPAQMVAEPDVGQIYSNTEWQIWVSVQETLDDGGFWVVVGNNVPVPRPQVWLPLVRRSTR